MRFYLTEVEIFVDDLGEYLIYAGPVIPAPSQEIAEQILKKENLYNFYVVGYFISEMSADDVLQNFNIC